MKNLDEIDKLLEDDFSLENYINKIDKNQIKTPPDLQEKILLKITNKKRKLHIDICKIAACLIFSLAICRTDFIKNDNIQKKEEEKTKTTISINEKISDFCKWVTTPIEKEEEEK